MRGSFNRVYVGKYQHGFIALIDNFALFVDETVVRAFRIFSLIRYRSGNVYCVADEDRFDKPQPVVSVAEGDRVDDLGGHSYGDRKDQGAMGDALTEGLSLDPLRIHVVRVEVPRLARMEYNVRLGDRAPDGS